MRLLNTATGASLGACAAAIAAIITQPTSMALVAVGVIGLSLAGACLGYISE